MIAEHITRTIAEARSTPNGIASVRADNLFGAFDYDLETRLGDGNERSPVIILYGDNGSGKTTILQLIYHMLSPALNQGHRSFIAQTPFSRFAVTLTNGLVVAASRPNGRTEGPFSMSVLDGELEVAYVEFGVDSHGDVPSGVDYPGEGGFTDQLKRIGIEFHYLSDARKYFSSEDELNAVATNDHALWTSYLTASSIGQYALWPRSQRPARGTGELEAAIDRAVQWVRQEALAGSTIGDANTNVIYQQIIQRVASPSRPSRVSPIRRAKNLVDMLERLSRTSELYADFGLTSPLATGEIVAAFNSASADKRDVILGVLEPYVEGIRARLDALHSIKEAMETFVRNVNTLYTNKRISFDLAGGLQIVSDRGDGLKPEMLSSGEQQLLLLLCSILCARSRPSIFMIDEPEISLNVKWERRLIQALLECTRGTNVQFLLATHSVELLAHHREYVVRLKSARQGSLTATGS